MATDHTHIPGEMLKRLRLVRGIKQISVAKKLGITQQAYSKLEKRKTLNSDKLKSLLTALNCSLNDLDEIIKFTFPTYNNTQTPS